jgi:hypothetical protein
MQSIISGSEELRHHCRRCKVKLATPVSNPLEAFCTKGCFRYFYKSKCILCDGTKSRTGLTCTRPACQSELRSKRRYGTLGKYAQKGRREVPGVAKPNPKVWHLSALGAALLQLVGYIVRHVPRPSLVAASIRGVMCLRGPLTLISIWFLYKLRRFVISSTAAVKYKRHQTGADGQGENDAQCHRKITRHRNVVIGTDPTEIANDAGGDQECQQQRDDSPCAEVAVA